MAIPKIHDWRERILVGVGVPVTNENLKFLDAWSRAEGGSASNNPFNTTLQTGGSTGFYNQLPGGIGVQNYGSPQAGIDATVNTLTNGRYGNIIGALKRGDNAMNAANALAASHWGTGGLVQKILGGDGGAGAAAAPPPAQGTAAASPTATGSPLTPPLSPISGPYDSGGQAGGEAAPSTRPPLSLTMGQILEQSRPSPEAVRMMAPLGPLSQRTTRSAAEVEAEDYGLQPLPQDEPVVRTIGSLQTGSTDSKFKTLDLGQDFDGPVHPNAQPIVGMAMQYLGTPYLWGGADPRKGFDCSGFVQYLYAQAGVAIPRTTYEQVKVGQAIKDPQDLQAGDIVLFSSHGDVH